MTWVKKTYVLSSVMFCRCKNDITFRTPHYCHGVSAAELLACWTQAQKARVQIAAATLSGNSLRQTVRTHRASIHQAAKLVATLLRIARVTAGLAESNGSLPTGLWLTSPAGWLPRTGMSSGTIRSAIECWLPFCIIVCAMDNFTVWHCPSILNSVANDAKYH